ncbi:MAG: HD domain-containing protein [Candidatus Cloacimonetes bacterium]|nr:HD domain-containing protein [Candidatus Cloacimonadota bacterium]
MEQYIRKAFAAILEKIKSGDIREKTVKCWVMAAQEGGWKPGDLENIPFTLLTETKGIDLIEHTVAVTLGAAGLAKAITETYDIMPFEINWDFIYAGGLLHDVGKLLEIELVDGKYRKGHKGRCARHPISGAILADRVGLPIEIVNIIGCHAKEGEGRPQRVETVLIHQADFATFNPMVMMAKGLLIEEGE